MDENLQSTSQKCEKIWFLRQDPGWSDLIFARGQIYPGKGPKIVKEKRAKNSQNKILGPASVIWNQISGRKRVNMATLSPMYSAGHKRTAWGCGRILNAEKLANIWAKIFKIWAKYTATFTCKQGQSQTFSFGGATGGASFATRGAVNGLCRTFRKRPTPVA